MSEKLEIQGDTYEDIGQRIGQPVPLPEMNQTGVVVGYCSARGLWAVKILFRGGIDYVPCTEAWFIRRGYGVMV